MHLILRWITILSFLSTSGSAFDIKHRNTTPRRINGDATASKTGTYGHGDDIIARPRLSLAPMMDYTNRHFRAMIRLVSRRTLLYTEMVAARDLLDARRSDRDTHHYLGQSAVVPEGPSVLQLGGNDATQLFRAARLHHRLSQQGRLCNYSSLNLNCGCPSPSVSGKKCFGAALMKDPSHVAKLVRAMKDGVEDTLPVSVKCRIGLYDGIVAPFSPSVYDDGEQSKREYEKLCKFVDAVASDGIVTSFIIHARIAVLGGSFSPADNRKIPPLKYEHVRRLTRDFPEFNFVLNGGIHSLKQVQEELERCDSLAGIMVGRALVADPWSFAMADELLYGEKDAGHTRQLCTNRRELLQAYGRHVDHEERHTDPSLIRRSLVAPCAHLFAGEANSKQFRMALDEIADRPERLEREAKARVWSNGGGVTTPSRLAMAFSASSTQSVAWDDLQAMDDARPSWDENEPPLSELILEAAQRIFGDDILDLDRRESHKRKICRETEEAKRKQSNMILSIGSNNGDGKKVSGGVVDGWFTNGLN